MLVYKSPYLTVTHEVDRKLFLMQWIKSPEDIPTFKREMENYTMHYKTHEPSYALWLQHNFSLVLDDITNEWIEHHVNEPCLEAGNEKCAFVVSKDILVHIKVIDVFDKYKSVVNVNHFASEDSARQWLFNNELAQPTNGKPKPQVTLEGIDADGNMLIKIPSTNIKATLKALNQQLSHHNFMSVYREKYDLLTKREKEVLSHIANGKTHSEISDILYLSSHTVSTHWRNIKKKLDIKKSVDALVFHYNFQQ